MKKFLQAFLIRVAFFLGLFIGVWMIVTKETEYFLVVIVFLMFLDFLKKRVKR